MGFCVNGPTRVWCPFRRGCVGLTLPFTPQGLLDLPVTLGSVSPVVPLRLTGGKHAERDTCVCVLPTVEGSGCASRVLRGLQVSLLADRGSALCALPTRLTLSHTHARTSARARVLHPASYTGIWNRSLFHMHFLRSPGRRMGLQSGPKLAVDHPN